MTEQRSPEKGLARGDLPKAEKSDKSEFGSDTGSFPRRLSSFGPPKGTGERPSLLDRLVASGALEADAEGAEAASRPVEVDTPPLGTKVPKDEAVRDLADELEPSRDSLELGRVSSMPLRDSDLQFVAESRDSGGFVSALGKDPDADQDSLAGPSARFDPELSRLDKPKEPEPRMPLPSVVLSPQLSTRNDSTERISTRPPRTPPIAHSLSPAASAKSLPPSETRRSGLWMGFAAAALVLVGVAVASFRGGQSAEQIAAASQPRVAEVESTVREVNPPLMPVVEPKLEPAPVAEAVPQASEHDAAREEARAERRRAREAARAAQAEAAGTVEGAAKVASKAVKASEGAAKPLNEQPTRDEVVAAMTAIQPRLKECVGDKHGLADVTVTVRSAGHVSYSIVAGSFVGTEEGSCIARVVKEARFPEFTEPFVRITYPFQL